ncbi:MAG: type I-C CRISPR-associated protein Cas8c/Csd1 [Planctomycetia bacterium]
MILRRLYELAERECLLEDPSVVIRQVACRIDIDDEGNFLGLHDLRDRVEKAARGKWPAKVIMSGGRSLPVPVRPVVRDALGNWKTTDPAAAGKEKPALFLADTIARVLPVDRLIDDDKLAKFASQRTTYWRFLRHAVAELNVEDLSPLLQFAVRLETDPDIAERLCVAVESLALAESDLCTLALSAEMGKCLLERTDIRNWWRQFFDRDFAVQQAAGTRGLCQVTGRETTIGVSVKTKIKGLVPIGCRADSYLVTGLDSADSFNLSGAESSMVSPEGIDGFTRALNALIANGLHGKTSSHRVGKVMFLFWTREQHDQQFMVLFLPDPEQVHSLLSTISQGKESPVATMQHAFYLLTLSGNSARVFVRDYLETTLLAVQKALAGWFYDLSIADISREGQGFPTSIFPLAQLAEATAMDADGVAPDTPARLMAAAIQGGPVSDSILNACLRRLRAEGADGFCTPRMALIKLILIRKGIQMTETLNAHDHHPAYIYGRLLAVFEQIQYDALGDVNASVVDKFYSTFSAAPALVFSRLFANAQNHLRKLKSEKPGAFINNDRLLSEIVSLLPPSPPSGQLVLQDQGRFALGYYHQRARRFQDIAERKAKKAEALLEAAAAAPA